MSGVSKYTEGQLADIAAYRAEGKTFAEIADKMSKHYGIEFTEPAIRSVYGRYKNMNGSDDSVVNIKTLKTLARTGRQNTKVAKENRVILAAMEAQEDLLEQIRSLVETLPFPSPSLPIRIKAPNKPLMTVEAMLSDIHYGKKTATFNLQVCRERMRKFTTALLASIERHEAHYNVERVILGFIGDLIENALMHGRESQVGCEFGNAEQIRWAIESLFQDVILPVAATGIDITAVGVSGNHDREEERPTYNDPGKASLAWVIYHSLRMLCERAGLTNVKWLIPEGVYQAVDVYGDTIIFEHADRIKGGNTKPSLLAHIAKRSTQLGRLVKGIRVGHWHEYSCYDNGKAIVNASVCGQDSYAEVEGYNSIPGQVITYYVKTKNRDNSYYYSFLVQLA